MSLSRFILPTLTLILGLVLGFFTNELILPSSLTPQEITQKSQAESVTEEDLPINLELLQNPMFYEWRVSIEGELIAKNEDAIVLRGKTRQAFTVPLRVALNSQIWTIFYHHTGGFPGEVKRVSLEDIPVGAILQGDIFIFEKEDGRNKIVGNSFTYYENLQEGNR